MSGPVVYVRTGSNVNDFVRSAKINIPREFLGVTSASAGIIHGEILYCGCPEMAVKRLGHIGILQAPLCCKLCRMRDC